MQASLSGRPQPLGKRDEKPVQNLEKQLGYRFTDVELLRCALTHSSYANEHHGNHLTCNERLEFLGDSILGLVTAEHLYHRFPTLPEGRMTRLRAELVCEQSLVCVAQTLHLGDYLRLGRGEENTGGRRRPSIQADCVEAIIAAIYLDSGMEQAKAFIQRYILSQLDRGITPERSTDNKTGLQELVQRKSGQVLSYELRKESGPDHCKEFTMAVCLNGKEIGQGTGHTKKEAEQAAAGAALALLQK